MYKGRTSKTQTATAVLLLLLGSAACRNARTEPQDEAQRSASPSGGADTREATEKGLRERVSAYWTTRQSLNLHECYRYYERAFRETYTADSFAKNFRRLNRFAPEFVGVEAVAIQESGKKATVKVKLRTEPDVLEGQEFITVHEETWIWEEGDWWKGSEPVMPSL